MKYTVLTVKEIDYKLRLDAKASVELEKKLGKNPLNIFISIANNSELPKLTDVIQVLHASMLSLQHGISLDDVYSIYDDYIDEGHTMVDLIPVLLDVFKASGFFKDEGTEPKNA